jgi:hypothetical protein
MKFRVISILNEEKKREWRHIMRHRYILIGGDDSREQGGIKIRNMPCTTCSHPVATSVYMSLTKVESLSNEILLDILEKHSRSIRPGRENDRF